MTNLGTNRKENIILFINPLIISITDGILPPKIKVKSK